MQARAPLPGPRVGLIIASASIVPAALDAGQSYLRQRLDGTPGVDLDLVLFQGMEWLFLGALTPIVWYLARRFPFDRRGWKQAFAAHAAGAAFLCVCWTSLGIALGYGLETRFAGAPLDQAYLGWLMTSAPWSVFLYFTVLGCVFAFTYFNEAREQEQRASLLSGQLAEARLAALRAQLHPHFLFNCLNAVTVMVRERNTASAGRMLEQLSDLLRELLRSDRPHEVPLADELGFVEKYLDIERTRFSDRLRVSVSVEDAARAALVPDLILQPLVENAIRHGVMSRAGAGTVAINAVVEGARLRLSVRDDGLGGPAGDARSGIGLANTRERLRALYGDAAGLTFEASSGAGAEVAITLPYRVATGGEACAR